jgi:ATPase subunit of ABC transporter with duplicated ATPase domains
MDEPTNHLDIESIIWLESFLKSLEGALLMTSHDREFMNRIVSKIAEIDGGEITIYSGNYDFYERERAMRETNREARTRASRRCSPRSSASSTASGRTPPRRRRCRAASRRSTRSKRSSCPKRRVVQVRLPRSARVGRPGGGDRRTQKIVRQARHLRRLQTSRSAAANAGR